MGTFGVSPRMNCNQILALLAIARFVEVDWGVNGIARFPFDYELSRFTFVPPVPRVTRKLAARTEIARGGHDEVRPIYREEFADFGMSRLFAERNWQLFLQKGNDY